MPTFNLFKPREPTPVFDALPPPWPVDAVSLRDQIATAAEAQHTHRELELDAHQPEDPEAIRWVAGVQDALFGGPNDSPRQNSAGTLLAALGKLVRKPGAESFRHFYALCAEADVLGVIDGFLPRVVQSKLAPGMVATIARRIAGQSPELSAVKLAIGLLGVSSDAADRDLLIELGRYEELTLFCAVALSHMLPDAEASEQAIWGLARSTYGWGRIQAVRRLKNAKDPEIRTWLLKEGHRNAIMTEEIAYFCAFEGCLLAALQSADPDEDLLDGAGQLLEALITGGPAEDIDDYADGAEAVRLYLEHVTARPSSDLRRFLHVRAIQRFEADAEGSWNEREQRGWSAARRRAIRTQAGAFLARPEWRDLADVGLLSERREDFWPAKAAAEALGIDVWPHHLRRQRQPGGDAWYFLMRTDSIDRVQQVIALAYEQLDLERVGSGPSTALGLGPAYRDDSALDFILQDLPRFPGLGWPLIEVGLRGRTIRTRNMAHKALEAWDRRQWPPEATSHLETALASEPDEEVADRIRNLLQGPPLD